MKPLYCVCKFWPYRENRWIDYFGKNAFIYCVLLAAIHGFCRLDASWASPGIIIHILCSAVY